jgi:hypothetical protein
VARREAHTRSGKRRPRGDRLETPAVAPPAAATRD